MQKEQEIFRVTTLPVGNGESEEKDDFFGNQPPDCFYQLEAELAALALGKAYTFGPTFRAETLTLLDT